jgi:ubiquinone/menaquinone biosynthesis C-methylase UbiE
LNSTDDPYSEALKVDAPESESYYLASLRTKTEQQKQLEGLLDASGIRPYTVADIACGGGGTSYHLAGRYPAAQYTLVDRNAQAVRLAEVAMRGRRADFLEADIYALPLESNAFDLVICWQTLSWLARPQQALQQLIRICRPGGKVYASSLFNFRHDVDIYASVIDHTRPSSRKQLAYPYNTYAISTVRNWLGGLVADLHVHNVSMPIDLNYDQRGLGTYTVQMHDGNRLQLSAGMLLNWGILELTK